MLKNWCIQNVVLEKTLESPLNSKEIKPVDLKRNQSWILIGRTDAKAEAPICWPLDVNSQLIGKNPDAGKDWRQKEKRVTKDEMAEWHHQFSGYELGKLWEMVRDREGWRATVPGITKSWTQLGDLTTISWIETLSWQWRLWILALPLLLKACVTHSKS